MGGGGTEPPVSSYGICGGGSRISGGVSVFGAGCVAAGSEVFFVGWGFGAADWGVAAAVERACDCAGTQAKRPSHARRIIRRACVALETRARRLPGKATFDARSLLTEIR